MNKKLRRNISMSDDEMAKAYSISSTGNKSEGIRIALNAYPVWIDWDDELPEIGGMYLTYWDDESIETFFITDEFLSREYIKVGTSVLLSWQPLPPPPESGQ